LLEVAATAAVTVVVVESELGVTLFTFVAV
jgi:hypothetical protein